MISSVVRTPVGGVDANGQPLQDSRLCETCLRLLKGIGGRVDHTGHLANLYHFSVLSAIGNVAADEVMGWLNRLAEYGYIYVDPYLGAGKIFVKVTATLEIDKKARLGWTVYRFTRPGVPS